MDTILARRRPSSPLLVLAYESLLEQMPFLERALSELIGPQDDAFWTAGETRCGEILHLCDGQAARFRNAVSAWVDFSIEYLTRQNKYLQTGQYACTDFEQIRRELYDNPKRMHDFYLFALMFAFVFSANYIGFFKFFCSEMLPRVQGARTVCDIGCGHGVYLTQMLLRSDRAFGRGLDISEASLATTRSLLHYHNLPARRYLLARADLRRGLPVEGQTQEGVTCFEVIEHLDDPLHALRELRRILSPEAPLCLSTAIRMESIDHLHVFNDADDVRALLSRAGFRILKDCCVPLSPGSATDPLEQQRLVDDPRVSVGYVALAV